MARAIDILFFLFSVATGNRGVDAYPSAPVLAAESQMTPDVKLPRAGIFEAYRMMMQEVGNDQQTNGVSAVASFRLLAAAVTFGCAHPTLGEEVAAAVVLHEPRGVTESQLIKHCREHLAEYKCPTKIYLVENIPTTATGKIRRRAVATALVDNQQ